MFTLAFKFRFAIFQFWIMCLFRFSIFQFFNFRLTVWNLSIFNFRCQFSKLKNLNLPPLPWGGGRGHGCASSGCSRSRGSVVDAILRGVRRPRIHHATTLGFSARNRDAHHLVRYTTPYLGACVALGYTMPQHSGFQRGTGIRIIL